jgi:zinc transporter 9
MTIMNETRKLLESKRYFTTKKKDDPQTDPEFADYLSGKAEEETKPKVEETIDLKGTDIPLQDHTEAYKYIRRHQRTGWEREREKTAQNVLRALYGNMIICAAKLAASISSGSSSMFSEFIHSLVDCGNQSLLLLGLRDSQNLADRRHPYGYGKSVYFWALVSALGTFFLGAGISGTQAWAELMEPSLNDITWEVWSVLGFSFVVDGYVLIKTVFGIQESMGKDSKLSFWTFFWKIRDPATMAVLLEDGAACLGIIICIGGITAASYTGMPVFDGLAGLGISGLLATMGLVLVRINHRFLLGQAVEPEITNGIEKILLSQRSIDAVHSVQSQWTGPHTFNFKAEVDFDGTYLAAKLMPRYQQEFLAVRDELDTELRVLLSWYAEDVMRTVEREVRHVEAEIRKEYPAAEFIELEPMSKHFDRFAIDDGMQAQLRRIEVEALNRYLRSLYQQRGPKASIADEESNQPSSDDKNDPKDQ